MKKMIALILGGMFIFSTFIFAAENEAVKETVDVQNTAVVDNTASVAVPEKVQPTEAVKTEVKPAVAVPETKAAIVENNTKSVVATPAPAKVEPAKLEKEIAPTVLQNVQTVQPTQPVQIQNPVRLSDKELGVAPKHIPELDITTTEEDTKSLYPAFLIMAKRGDVPVLKVFLEKRLDINRKNDLGMTALLEAAKANQYKTVKFLISKDADAKIVSNNGINALRFAVENKNKNLVKLLLKQELNVCEKDALGQTPLMISIEKNYYEITKLLLKNLEGFDVDVQDKNGKSLLMAAVENNDVSLVKNLMSKNANIWLLNNKNQDALSIAEKHNNKKLIKILQNQMKEDKQKGPKVEHWLRKPGDITNSGLK